METLTRLAREEWIMRSKKSCQYCKHELTECGVGSIGHDNGVCLGCCGVGRFVGERIYGGTRCSQADHDIGSVEGGMMDEVEFFKRNPKAVGLIHFEPIKEAA